MANRVATSADLTTHANWITNNILLTYGGSPMQVGDVIIDDNTTKYYGDILVNPLLQDNLIGAASGNNLNDVNFAVTTTISTNHPTKGTLRIPDGLGGFDEYAYNGYTDSAFTLDATIHPTGLVRTYAGSESMYASWVRRGFTMWFDAIGMGINIADPSNSFQDFTFATGTNSKTAASWKYISDLQHKVHIRPLNGLVGFRDNPSNGGMFSVVGIPNIVMDGATASHRGLTNMSWNYTFLHGKSGFLGWGFSEVNGQCFGFEPGVDAENATYEANCIEAIGKFAGFRVVQGGDATGDDINIKLFKITNCYRHDSRGEGVYAGTTQGVGNPRFEKVIIENNLFARIGAESIQVQDQLNNALRSSFSHNILLMSGTEHMAPFQAFQTNGWQLVFGDGNTILEKNITDGWGANALSIFGNSFGTGVGTIDFKDNLFIRGNKGMYIQPSTAGLNNLKIRFNRNYFLEHTHFTEGQPDEIDSSYLISENNGDVDFKFFDLIHDGTYQTPLFENNFTYDSKVTEDATKVFDDYLNTGLEYGKVGTNYKDYRGKFANTYTPIQGGERRIVSVANNGSGVARFTIEQPHGLVTGDSVIIDGTVNYDGYYQGAVVVINTTQYDVTGTTFVATETGEAAKPITYNAGEVVNVEHATDGSALYKCILTYEETNYHNLNLHLDTTHWVRLYFDVNGVRSDKVGYTGTPDPATRGVFPPDDVRLNKAGEWNKIGLGLINNESEYTEYQWQWSYTGNEGTYVDIAYSNAINRVFKPEITGYYRVKIKLKTNSTSKVEYINHGLITI